MLSEREAATLALLIETLLPSLEPEQGDNPALFRTGARELPILPQTLEALSLLASPQRRELRWLLQLLEQRLFIAALCGFRQPFSQLDQQQRERVLQALALSRIERLRAGFQGLKRLAAFLFYTIRPDGNTNPVWPQIGYQDSQNRSSYSDRLVYTQITKPIIIECDVCVVGSGAGGGVIAAQLAAAGKRVVVLDAGPALHASEFDQHELESMQSLYLERGLLLTRDLATIVLGGRAVGGGTTVNWQSCFKLPDAIREEWSHRSGVPLFTSDEFTSAMNVVSARAHISTQESVVNANNAALQRGCEQLGYGWQVIPRNSHGCDPEQCGYCVFGCRHGGKQSTAFTWLQDAQQYDTTIIPSCTAERILHENGRVTGVEARCSGPAGEHELRVRAPVVVSAAGGIHSPALLLRSGIRLPAVGRHLYLHPTTAVAGFYDEPIRPWSGPPQTIVCDELANLSGNFGCRIETAPTHPGLFALALPWEDARAHRRMMQDIAHSAVFIVLTRDQASGRVSIARDGRPLIDYRMGSRELYSMNRGVEASIRLHAAAGAKRIGTLHSRDAIHDCTTPPQLDAWLEVVRRQSHGRHWSPLFSAHQMGTCRMGSSRDSAVCDENGEVFGVRGLYIGDAAAFPASSGVNPMLTIMALAYCIAGRISER